MPWTWALGAPVFGRDEVICAFRAARLCHLQLGQLKCEVQTQMEAFKHPWARSRDQLHELAVSSFIFLWVIGRFGRSPALTSTFVDSPAAAPLGPCNKHHSYLTHTQ